jgi:hypothetical protein
MHDRHARQLPEALDHPVVAGFVSLYTVCRPPRAVLVRDRRGSRALLLAHGVT